MQISLKWVNELVNIESVDLEYLIEKLTLGGFEVEEVLEIEVGNKKTIVLDISATANRSDSLSIQGISLEIAALLHEPPKISKYSTNTFSLQDQVKSLPKIRGVKNNCSAFITVVIQNLNDLTSPKWLKEKLIASGLMPENNLSDFQNYILLETGYPFEFYDFDNISSKIENSKFNLSLAYSNNGEKFIAADQLKYKLNDSILVIKANEVPISIGGIIPQNEFSYSNTTTALLVEGSIFNSALIRQQSRILGIRTDRSARYEKSLKATNILEACYRLVSLLRLSNPHLICKLHTLSQTNPKPYTTIILHYETIKKTLGPVKNSINSDYISPTTISNYLDRLDFKYNYDSNNLFWDVQISDLRNDDISREIDLIEEIGRLYGFNNFLTQLPKIRAIGTEDFSYQTRLKVTSCLLNLGFNELIHYSLVNENTYSSNKIKLINPLVKDYSNLRSSLLPSLIEAVHENLKKCNCAIDGFEYGHVFSGDNPIKLIEKEYVAGIFGGVKTKSSWSDLSKPLSWFDAKGKIEQVFKKLDLLTYWKTHSPTRNKNILHPYCTSELFLADGKSLGIFGQIHPILAHKLNLISNLYLFEFNLTFITEQIQNNKLTSYQEYSVYPKIIKDLSFIIDKNLCFGELQKILYLNGSKFLTEINLLDEYKGNSISQTQTSLCLQLIFQSNEKTLQKSEVEIVVKNLQLLLTNRFKAIIRG